MRFTIAMLAILAAAGASAQRAADHGPFTDEEAELLGAVWPQIREAADFDDIDWRSVGLSRPPGSAEARRLMDDNWGELRESTRFESIDWDEVGYGASRSRNRNEPWSDEQWRESPFSVEEARALSDAWPQIREAGSFEDINWRSVGLAGPPGDREARRLMATNWESVRSAERFEDIDWRTLDDR